MVATQTCSQTTSYRYDLKRLTIHNCTNCTQLYKFEKKMVPQDIEEKEELSIALSKYGVSLKQYEAQVKTPKKKRPAAEDIAPELRRSPRLAGASNQEHNIGEGVRRNLFDS
jgi:hypothetical protein